MTLDSIWDDEGEYLTKKSKGFRGRTTGCSCCSSELYSKEEVKKHSIESLSYIMRACNYFKWDINKLIKEAREEIKNQPAKEGSF